MLSLLLKEREKEYLKADIKIVVDGLDESLVIRKILKSLKSYLIIDENEKI